MVFKPVLGPLPVDAWEEFIVIIKALQSKALCFDLWMSQRKEPCGSLHQQKMISPPGWDVWFDLLQLLEWLEALLKVTYRLRGFWAKPSTTVCSSAPSGASVALLRCSLSSFVPAHLVSWSSPFFLWSVWKILVSICRFGSCFSSCSNKVRRSAPLSVDQLQVLAQLLDLLVLYT